MTSIEKITKLSLMILPIIFTNSYPNQNFGLNTAFYCDLEY